MSEKILAVVLMVCAIFVCYNGGIVIDTPLLPDQPVTPIYSVERPVVNLPLELRQSNWVGRQSEGSCVHATMISLMRWQGRNALAAKWRKMYDSGETPAGLSGKFDREGVRYAYTTSGDVKFLEWACRTRRGCGITVMGGVHMVALVHLDDKWACLLNNNEVSKYKWVPRAALIAEWKASDGWAVTPLYAPAAPLPR